LSVAIYPYYCFKSLIDFAVSDKLQFMKIIQAVKEL